MMKYSSLNPSSFFEISGDGPTVRGEMQRCVHCSAHFPIQPGSGKIRGFCYRCNGMICGPGCVDCVPAEAQLEIMEGTRNPSSVSVGVIWTPGGNDGGN